LMFCSYFSFSKLSFFCSVQNDKTVSEVAKYWLSIKCNIALLIFGGAD